MNPSKNYKLSYKNPSKNYKLSYMNPSKTKTITTCNLLFLEGFM
jgi:hypothetical protein